MKTNKKTVPTKVGTERLAGGAGALAAIQSEEAKLRRLVMSCLLWEDVAYSSGNEIVQEICKTIPKVSAKACYEIAVSARRDQKLRHVPLLLIREMARYTEHSKFVRNAVREVCTRPDQLTELLSIYWKTNSGKKAIKKQLAAGMADALNSFNEYQLSKWNRDADVKLRDVLFLTHAKPATQENARLFKALADNTLATPNTWEVGLSAAKSEADKVKVWESLIAENKLGALALLKNLRNMIQSGVPKSTIRKAIKQASPTMLLPIDFVKAGDYAPDYLADLEDLMFRCLGEYPKLKGETVFVLDVSGSMKTSVSSKSNYTRYDAGKAMTMLAREMCESCTIYLTAGSDGARTHSTKKVSGFRGFGLMGEIDRISQTLGGGGIFTRQCMDYIRDQEKEVPDRVIVFSDSQDCDYHYGNKTLPKPCGVANYIIDVSSHANGVNYKGIWTAEIAGWSEHFLKYIALLESEKLN